MGFRYWYEGIIFITIFATLVGVPSFFTAVIGSKMLNDLGNFPSRSAQIQSSACWKVLVVEIITFILFAGFFHLFS